MTTPAPTLPAGWTPTVSGCLRTDDFWIWNYGGVDDQRTVLGGPSQTTNCFPSTWNPASPYTGWTCPRDYTIACQGTDSISAITCCPTAYDFTCAIPSSGQTVNTHGSWFPCISQYPTGGETWTVTTTDFNANTQTVKTTVNRAGLHLFALAAVYTTQTSTSSDVSTTQTASTQSASQTSTTSSLASGQAGSKGLSGGASAGIGVAAGAVVVLAALLGWFLLRRRRRHAAVPAEAAADPKPYAKDTTATAAPQELPTSITPAELGSYR